MALTVKCKDLRHQPAHRLCHKGPTQQQHQSRREGPQTCRETPGPSQAPGLASASFHLHCHGAQEDRRTLWPSG